MIHNLFKVLISSDRKDNIRCYLVKTNICTKTTATVNCIVNNYFKSKKFKQGIYKTIRPKQKNHLK